MVQTQERGGARSVPTAQLAWLEQELSRWQAQGQVDAAAAAAIRGQYTARRRFSVARLMLSLGGAFVGVGMLWLVAANLDQLSPLTRFAGVTLLWLGAVGGAEALATRRSDDGDAVLGAARLLAALLFGAVVFQAAQSLQVPAYDAGLVGAWGAGALLYAYAVRAVAPLLVGIGASVGWYVWVVVERTESVAGAAVALLLAAALATAVAVVHDARWQRTFSAPWRVASALLTLLGLFLAALPGIDGSVDMAGRAAMAGAVVVLLQSAPRPTWATGRGSWSSARRSARECWA